MGREVRPVAVDWEHPRESGTYTDGSPRYKPLLPRGDLQRDLADYAENPEDWDNRAPDPADYMPELREGTPYGWQFYENVSEGTPLSPVFATKDELASWLSSPAAGRHQVSPSAAVRFVADGWAPSFVMTPETGLVPGIEWAGRNQP